MYSSTILRETNQVDSRLQSLGLNRQDLILVASRALSARNESVPTDPINSPGQLSYIHGTRALRAVLMSKEGWKLDRTENVEATINLELGVRLIFQNVDYACGIQSPKPLSAKGRGAARMVAEGTPYLFPEFEMERKARSKMETWFLCVSTHDEGFRCELMKPESIEAGVFVGEMERIYLYAENPAPVSPVHTGDESTADDFDVHVSKK